MAVTGARVTVGTTATLIAQADADGVSVAVRNADATVSADIGGSGVVSGAGYLLLAGSSVSFDLDAGESVYGIVASGSIVAHVLRNRG